MDPRRSVGKRGEEEAARFLQKRGFAILDRNVRSRLGEIDLVARDGKALVFVEVKTLRERDGDPPQAAVGQSKQRRLGRLAPPHLQGKGPGGAAAPALPQGEAPGRGPLPLRRGRRHPGRPGPRHGPSPSPRRFRRGGLVESPHPPRSSPASALHLARQCCDKEPHRNGRKGSQRFLISVTKGGLRCASISRGSDPSSGTRRAVSRAPTRTPKTPCPRTSSRWHRRPSRTRRAPSARISSPSLRRSVRRAPRSGGPPGMTSSPS